MDKFARNFRGLTLLLVQLAGGKKLLVIPHMIQREFSCPLCQIKYKVHLDHSYKVLKLVHVKS